jgi:membrane protein YdbS with pleckstrin-like domain
MPDIFISEPKKDIPEDTTEPVEKMAVSGNARRSLSAFNLYPTGIDFETRNEEEKVILLLRAHPVTNVKWVLITILMFIVPGVARSLGIFNALPMGFDLIITLAWYLVTMVYALENFLNWYFNVHIVTTTRVIDVDFYNLINKQVSDANMDKIQDVTYNMGGVARTVFNYGDVFIQTAAEVSEFDFLAVPNPDKVAKIIKDMIKNEEEEDEHGKS